MDLGEALRALLRRWLILLCGLALTGGVAAWVYTRTPVTYQSSAQALLLLPPNANSPEYDSNPFLYLPNGLNVLARVVAVTPTTPQFRREMREAGFTSQYELSVETGGSMVTFSSEGLDPENVVATRDELMRRFELEIGHVQDDEGAPSRQRAHMRPLAKSDQATPLTGDRLRSIAVAGGTGVVLTLILALSLDRWLLRRAQRKGAQVDETAAVLSSGSGLAPEDRDGTDAAEPATWTASAPEGEPESEVSAINAEVPQDSSSAPTGHATQDAADEAYQPDSKPVDDQPVNDVTDAHAHDEPKDGATGPEGEDNLSDSSLSDAEEAADSPARDSDTVGGPRART